MYQFSGRLKTFSLTLIVFGFVGLAYSFYNGSQKTLEDAKHAIEAANSDAHGWCCMAKLHTVLLQRKQSMIRMQEKHANKEHTARKHATEDTETTQWGGA